MMNFLMDYISINKDEVRYMPTKKPRYTIIVDDELLKRIDDFRFENRYSSRSAATLELIRLGLDALEQQNSGLKNFPKNKKE